MVSVLILTRDEEQDLPGCLDSVRWSDDIHVYDSYSTDRTVEIARAYGAKLHQRVFDSYSGQRNAALVESCFRYPWLLILDADERANPALAQALALRTGAAAAEVCAFRLRRRDHFLGRWLRHAQTTPFYIRVIRLGHARFRREINEVLEVDGVTVDLPELFFDHYPFSKGITHWVAKHNSYSSAEARIVAQSAFAGELSWRKALFARDFNQRHAARKAVFYSLPGRPLLRWCYLMFYRRGILDGRAGWVYSTLQAFYEWLIVLKTQELQAPTQQSQSAPQLPASPVTPVATPLAAEAQETSPAVPARLEDLSR